MYVPRSSPSLAFPIICGRRNGYENHSFTLSCPVRPSQNFKPTFSIYLLHKFFRVFPIGLLYSSSCASNILSMCHPFSCPYHFISIFSVIFFVSHERFHVESITQKPDHLQFCSNCMCLFTSMIEATVPNFRKIGQVFLEIRPPKKWKFYPKNCA